MKKPFGHRLHLKNANKREPNSKNDRKDLVLTQFLLLVF